MLSQFVFVLRATTSKQHEERYTMFSRFVFVQRMRIKQTFPDDRKGRHGRITHTPHMSHVSHVSHMSHTTHTSTQTPPRPHTPNHRKLLLPFVRVCLNSQRSDIRCTAQQSHCVDTICGHHKNTQITKARRPNAISSL